MNDSKLEPILKYFPDLTDLQRERFAALMQDRAYLEACYTQGAQRALSVSYRTLEKVYKKIGFPADLFAPVRSF